MVRPYTRRTARPARFASVFVRCLFDILHPIEEKKQPNAFLGETKAGKGKDNGLWCVNFLDLELTLMVFLKEHQETEAGSVDEEAVTEVVEEEGSAAEEAEDGVDSEIVEGEAGEVCSPHRLQNSEGNPSFPGGGVRGGGIQSRGGPGRGGDRARGSRGGGRGGRGGARGGSKTVLEPHRHPGVFIAKGKDHMLVTKNFAPGESVYGEKRISIEGGVDGTKVEYRVWNPFRSKLAAGVLGGLDDIFIAPGKKVLYLGAASGTSVSHVADIVGPVSDHSCHIRHDFDLCRTRRKV